MDVAHRRAGVLPPPGRDRPGALDQIDWILASATVALLGFGLIIVTVASGSAGTHLSSATQHQFLFDVIGLGLAATTMFLDYRRLEGLDLVVYSAAIVLLLAVLSPLGSRVNGARSWFSFGGFELQPAELIKLGLSLVLARIADRAYRIRNAFDTRPLIVSIAAFALPAGLIMLQPDLGEVLVLAAITITIVAVAGAAPRHLAVGALVGTIAVIVLLQSGAVKHYQLDRLTYFVNPDRAASGTAGYNAHEAQIAIGAGGVLGTGLFHGTQTKLHFVPEQETDFIFSVVGEQLGFVGTVTMLALDAIIVWRLWRSAVLARDLTGTLICAGALALFLFHLFENAGMNMGIMPITGIPLPLVSYGGSATIVTLVAIGLALSVHRHRFS